jgi:hypothetical protein
MGVVRIDPRGRAQEHVVNPFGPAGAAPPFYMIPKGGCAQIQGGPVNGDVGVTYKYQRPGPDPAWRAHHKRSGCGRRVASIRELQALAHVTVLPVAGLVVTIRMPGKVTDDRDVNVDQPRIAT